MSPPLQLLHLANCHSNNVGNGAIILGAERVLREDVGPHVTFTREAWDDYTLADVKKFDGKFVDLINAHEGLIVGGAVMLNGMRRYQHTGTRFDLTPELWSKIRIPMVFYSVAYGAHRKQRYYHRDQVRRFLEERILPGGNVLFSVRNDGTKAWLEAVLGYPSEKIVEIPDPALYVPTIDAPHAEVMPGRVNILLVLTGEGDVYRFGGRWPDRVWRHFPGWKRRKQAFLRGLAQALARIVATYHANIILGTHCPSGTKIVAELLAECPVAIVAQSVALACAPSATAAACFYDLYRKVDLVIGMRVHSVTPAVGMGVPVVAIAAFDRIEYSMRDAGLSELTVSPHDPMFADALYAKVSHVLEHRREVAQKVQAVNPRMRERTARFNAQVASFLENRRG